MLYSHREVPESLKIYLVVFCAIVFPRKPCSSLALQTKQGTIILNGFQTVAHTVGHVNSTVAVDACLVSEVAVDEDLWGLNEAVVNDDG